MLLKTSVKCTILRPVNFIAVPNCQICVNCKPVESSHIWRRVSFQRNFKLCIGNCSLLLYYIHSSRRHIILKFPVTMRVIWLVSRFTFTAYSKVAKFGRSSGTVQSKLSCYFTIEYSSNIHQHRTTLFQIANGLSQFWWPNFLQLLLQYHCRSPLSITYISQDYNCFFAFYCNKSSPTAINALQ